MVSDGRNGHNHLYRYSPRRIFIRAIGRQQGKPNKAKMIQFISKILLGASRSPRWRQVRDDFIAKNPKCAVCGSKKNVVAHHKLPFHIFPERELDPTNLVTLCENTVNCHLTFGHLGSFLKYNKDVEADILIWNKKLQ